MQTAPLMKLLKHSNVKNVLSKHRGNIVMTNGCFDILHRGHLDYLCKSSLFKDIFCIVVNSDISVKKLKGPNRPINNEADRAFMLCCLEFVDYVLISGDSERVDEEIRLIRPDVYTKAGDYTIDSLNSNEKKALDSIGCTNIVILPYTENYSTTSIIERSKKA